MADYDSLSAAMAAGDELAEAELRYDLLAEAFVEKPQLRSQLNTQLERAKAEIVRLRALLEKPDASKEKTDAGRVIAFNGDRFRKSG
ncbi:terminase small subunit [Gordonia phage Leroy]|nr:terminase small subunit [Gordonia phage Leroy]